MRIFVVLLLVIWQDTEIRAEI